MSRSKRKPYQTDQQRATPGSTAKRKANRAVRVANKLACRGRIARELSNGKQYRKESNSYDIRDYSFYCPEIKKAYRK